MEGHVVNGLDKQPIASIADTIKSLGFNCIRLPFSLEQYYDNPVIDENRLTANPELQGMTSMEVFDAVVMGLTDAGLMVILNNHNSGAGWCCSEQDGEGLWWTHDYPEEQWLSALEGLADRYAENSLVVGMDLRNELRRAHGHSPTWGDGNVKYDWAKAAEKAGNLVLSVNENLLIIVEGLEYAGTVEGAKIHPIQLSKPQQLVYSGHLYTWFFDSSLPYDQLKEQMTQRQLFVNEAGHPYSAAYWMGEFGTGDNSDGWQMMIQLLQDCDCDWSYWAIDGYKYPGEDESFGLLLDDYKTIRHQWLIDQLKSIMQPQ